MNVKGYEPAFPCEITWSEGQLQGKQTGNSSGICPGLSKREYFAGLAMQGAISSLSMTTTKAWAERGGIIKSSVEMADALLAELSKEQS